MVVVGIDEAGRGAWAGPVAVAAVILDENSELVNIVADSKKLSVQRREKLYDMILAGAKYSSIIFVDNDYIDEHNILKATLFGMQKSLQNMTITPDIVMIDGNQAPALPYNVKTVVSGDSKIPAISAASILAKVARDRFMQDLDLNVPGWFFAKHKGYGTKLHMECLANNKYVSRYHRKSFKPIAKLVADRIYLNA